MSDELWLWAVRMAGAFHFVTLALAWRTPIPPGWEENLATLPEIHRRFSIAQNLAIGGVIAFCGALCLGFAPVLLETSPASRLLNAGLALWWGARLAVLPFLKVRPALTTPWLRCGYVLLNLQCALFAAGFAWLAVRE
jgi:hypothetical protein